MNRITHLLILVVCFSAGLPATELEAEQSINVMSFNIRYDNLRDGLDNWKFRAKHVAEMFKKHDVAAGGLQEVQHHQLVWLKQALPDYDFVGVGRDDGKKKGEYAPVFFRKADFELLKTQTVWLSETPQKVGSKGWDAALPRIATFAVLKHKSAGITMLLGNAHYDHVGALARKNSGAVIHEYISDIRSEMKLPLLVVTGDFNCLPQSVPFKAIESGNVLFDTHSLTENRVGPNSTWNGFRAVQPDRRIDYVFVNKGITVLQHLTDAAKVNGRYPSDHLPVIVKIKLKE